MHQLSSTTAKRLLSAGDGIQVVVTLGRARASFVLLLMLCLSAPLKPNSCSAQNNGDRGIEIASIDAQTRWAFRALSPVTVGSPIIRFGDVVEPLDPNMAGWQRLQHSLIALVPIDGKPMTIERNRLADAIRGAEATPRAIDWVGPTTIRVVYRPSASAASRDQTQRVSYANDDPSPTAYRGPVLPVPEAERILRWIYLAIDRQHASISEAYRIEIDRKQPRLAALRSIAGVTSIEFRDQIREGPCRLHVVARGVDGPVESDLDAMLTLHPTVVVARIGLSRGHRIEAGDLTIQSIPKEELKVDFEQDPSALIGLEVRNSLRANRPIVRGDLGAPILVHRGDLIEIRVVAGGIIITTNAKSLGNGAASDLIEVETMQPRKRLIARVVQPGMVEIVTRAPRVKP
jgi:flagella basal body P-ring formation protein FlgA